MFPKSLPWDGQPDPWAVASRWALDRRVTHLSIGDLRFDAARGILVPPTIVSGSRTSVVNSAGPGVVVVGANSSNQTNRDALGNGDFTALFIGNPVASATEARFALGQGSGANEIAFGANFSDQFTATGASGRFSLTMLQSGVNRSHAFVAGAADGTVKCFLMRKRGTTVTAWVNGVSQTVTSSGGFTGSPAGASDTLRIGGSSANGSVAFGGGAGDSVLNAVAVLQFALLDDECQQLSTINGAYGLLFDPRRIWVPVTAAAGGASGTLARTNANDTSAASGTTTIVGTSARTNANDTSSAAGTTTIVGTLARTNANDTSSAAGSVGSGVSGTLARTNANDSVSASGTTTVVGTSARTNANDASSASGTTTVNGTAARTNANDTATASGAAGTVTGTSATTNASDYSSATGSSGTASAGVGSYEPKKKRFITKVGDKLVITTSATKALQALEADETPAEEAAETIQEQKTEEAAKIEVPIKAMKAQAKVFQKDAAIVQMIKRAEYEAAVQLYERLKRQQDEEDVELLLMAL